MEGSGSPLACARSPTRAAPHVNARINEYITYGSSCQPLSARRVQTPPIDILTFEFHKKHQMQARQPRFSTAAQAKFSWVTMAGGPGTVSQGYGGCYLHLLNGAVLFNVIKT